MLQYKCSSYSSHVRSYVAADVKARVHHNSMDTSSLPDMYIYLETMSRRADCVHIRQTTSAHALTNTYVTLLFDEQQITQARRSFIVQYLHI